MATTYPVLRWQIGDVRISRVVEAEGPTPGTFLFADATPEKLLQHAWLKPHFMTEEGMLISSIHAFVVESQGKTIVVDTCIGNDKPRAVKNWNMRKGPYAYDICRINSNVILRTERYPSLRSKTEISNPLPSRNSTFSDETVVSTASCGRKPFWFTKSMIFVSKRPSVVT